MILLHGPVAFFLKVSSNVITNVNLQFYGHTAHWGTSFEITLSLINYESFRCPTMKNITIYRI